MTNHVNICGIAKFANGTEFVIYESTDSGKHTRYPIYAAHEGRTCGHANRLAAAWDSVRYMAGISPITGRSDDKLRNAKRLPPLDWLPGAQTEKAA